MRLLLLLGWLVLAGCTRDIPQDVTELVYATPYPPGHPFSRADREWIDFVETESGGSLRIVVNWSGALISSEHSLVEIRHGVADIGLITPIYVKGGAHLIRVQSGFYSGADTVEEQVALYHCLADGNAQFARELEGLKVLAVQGGSLPGVVTVDRPIRRLEDLSGLRLRAPTELLAVLRELGVDAVSMPMGDVYSAMAKGVLDGVVAPPDTFRSLHFADVAQYYADIVVPRGAYPARAMDMESWRQLDAEQQRILEEGIGVWEAALARQTREATEEGLEVAREAGVQFTSISPQDQARFDALYIEEAERNAATLARYGIDGRSVLDIARASVTANGDIDCVGGTN